MRVRKGNVKYRASNNTKTPFLFQLPINHEITFSRWMNPPGLSWSAWRCSDRWWGSRWTLPQTCSHHLSFLEYGYSFLLTCNVTWSECENVRPWVSMIEGHRQKRKLVQLHSSDFLTVPVISFLPCVIVCCIPFLFWIKCVIHVLCIRQIGESWLNICMRMHSIVEVFALSNIGGFQGSSFLPSQVSAG